MPTIHNVYTPTLHAFGQTISDAALRLVDAWKRRRRSRHAYQALATLDECTLRDLGFTRSELLSLANRPDDRDRGRYWGG